MTQNPFYLHKIRRLSQALLISGALNAALLAFFCYWVIWERPPTPYCELKPADGHQQELPLADCRGCAEVLAVFETKSFNQLVNQLQSKKMIENGFTERDLALSSLVAFYYFDIERALPLQEKPHQKRILKWKNRVTGGSIPVAIYPGLSDQQFESIIAFIKTERWPMTSEGMFKLLQKQKAKQNIDSSLAEAFVLTPEFLSIEMLFSRTSPSIRRQKLLQVVLEGSWDALKQYASQQRQLNDLSSARRQKFLLNYVSKGSQTAAYLLVEIEPEFAIKKIDDAQAIAVLQLLPNRTKESEEFALAMLTSPRSTDVWQQASLRLYEYAGESNPKNWDYNASLKRFAPEKIGNQTTSVVAEPAPKKEEILLSLPQLPAPSAPSPIKTISVLPSQPLKQALEPKKETVKETASSKSRPLKTAISAPIPKKEIKPIAATAKPSKHPTFKRPSYRLYTVQEGDSLWKISRRFNVNMETLKQINQIQSSAIKPGAVLKIP